MCVCVRESECVCESECVLGESECVGCVCVRVSVCWVCVCESECV